MSGAGTSTARFARFLAGLASVSVGTLMNVTIGISREVLREVLLHWLRPAEPHEARALLNECIRARDEHWSASEYSDLLVRMRAFLKHYPETV